MVGYWKLTEAQIVESVEHQTQLQLAKPDIIEGPGCMKCEQHWTKAKGTPCPGSTSE